MSFLTIGIIWVNHHAMIGRLRQTDHTILVLNLFLLLSIGLLPFATSLMARYLREPHGQHLAAAVYSGAFLLMSLIFSLMQRHILFGKTHLLSEDLDEQRRRSILRWGITGSSPTPGHRAGPGLALRDGGHLRGVAVFYALPIASGNTS